MSKSDHHALSGAMVQSNHGTIVKKSRWEHLQMHAIVLPEVESPSPALPEAQIEAVHSKVDPTDYPQLRILLRDSGLAFKPKFSQSEAAELLVTSTKTLRKWTRMGLIPFHVEPSGKPYFSPHDIEDILSNSARNRNQEN